MEMRTQLMFATISTEVVVTFIDWFAMVIDEYGGTSNDNSHSRSLTSAVVTQSLIAPKHK